MKLRKRAHLQCVFGAHELRRFRDPPAAARKDADRLGSPLMVWAEREMPANGSAEVVRLEDGILRSRGLGAALSPPLSLVHDDLGVPYDPTRESRLDRLIAAACGLDNAARDRGTRLIARLRELGLTKYNTGGPMPCDVCAGRRILVVGQVEGDASIRKDCAGVATNAGLLRAARDAKPQAPIL